MKTGHIFWGVFFISFGSMIILLNLNAILFDISDLWDWWPVLIILWGVSILKLSDGIKKALAAASGLLSAVVFVSLFSYMFGWVDESNWHFRRTCDNDRADFFDDEEWNVSKTIAYDSSFKTAFLNIKAGAGDFRIENNSDELISISGCGVLKDHALNQDTTQNHVEIFYRANLFKDIFNSDFERDVDIRINKNPIWDISVNVGAAAFEADLREFKIRNLDFNIGAAGVELTLGDEYDSTNVSIQSGASGVEISIPESSGCELISHAGFTSGIDLEDFTTFDKDHYRTSNFKTATKKIFIEISGGAAGFEVRRY